MFACLCHLVLIIFCNRENTHRFLRNPKAGSPVKLLLFVNVLFSAINALHPLVIFNLQDINTRIISWNGINCLITEQ